ncbi:hypothetical protein ACQBAU_01295 [Propionibacteriaceae bacterium Y2011]
MVERHGKAVAAVVGMAHLEEIRRLEQDLRESVLLLARVATDSGARTDLDTAIEALGLNRGELEAELADDRVSALEESPHTIPLAEALSALGRVIYGLEAATEPAVDQVPDWLVHTLVNVVKMPRQEVDRLTPAQAHQVWDAYVSSPRD